MVVRVAQRVRAGVAATVRVVVAADSPEILEACSRYGVVCVLTRADHPSGSDRLAEASTLLNLADHEVVVNVQGDEPLIDTELVNAVAQLLEKHPLASMGTAAHAIDQLSDYTNTNIVKAAVDAAGMAMYFSRAPIPWWRDGQSSEGFTALPHPAPLRHIGIYAYRVDFLRLFPSLPVSPLEAAESLEQLRAMWHGYRIAVHIAKRAPGSGVDTPEDLERVRRIFLGST